MRQSTNIKILMVEIVNGNLGDAVIAENARAILRKGMHLSGKKNFDIIRHNIYNIDFEKIKYVDAIVFVGGVMLKFKREKIYKLVAELLERADECGVPVFFNSCGVEGYDEEDERCQLIKCAVNRQCVKAISIRDDIALFKRCFLSNKNIRVSSVFDSAIFTQKVYKIKKEKSDVIGLGIGRESLFTEHGSPEIDEEFLLKFWLEVIEILEKQGRRWSLFTNGASGDERFAEKILQAVGHGQKLPKPLEAKQLVKAISSFSAILACRMHSNIIAYSLKIPSVGLVWNEKLEFWGKKIGYPNRFIKPSDMNAQNAVKCVLDAERKGTRSPNLLQYFGIFFPMLRFIKRYAKIRSECFENLDFSERLIATALGGKQMRYKNLNSISAFGESLKKGFKWFELDVRLTADDRLVCVNGWTEDTFSLLNAQTNKGEAMLYDEFMASKYYGFYETSNFQEFVKQFSQRAPKGSKLIIDVGRPTPVQLKEMLKQISQQAKKFLPDNQGIIIRLQREKDVKILRDMKLNFDIAFYLAGEQETAKGLMADAQQVSQYCTENDIKYVTMRADTFNPSIAQHLHNNNLKCILLSFTKTDNIIKAVLGGADLIGSTLVGVNELNSLIR